MIWKDLNLENQRLYIEIHKKRFSPVFTTLGREKLPGKNQVFTRFLPGGKYRPVFTDQPCHHVMHAVQWCDHLVFDQSPQNSDVFTDL